MRLVLIPLATLLASLSLATPRTVSACSCTNIPDLARAISESDAIFTGIVTATVASSWGRVKQLYR